MLVGHRLSQLLLLTAPKSASAGVFAIVYNTPACDVGSNCAFVAAGCVFQLKMFTHRIRQLRIHSQRLVDIVYTWKFQ